LSFDVTPKKVRGLCATIGSASIAFLAGIQQAADADRDANEGQIQ